MSSPVNTANSPIQTDGSNLALIIYVSGTVSYMCEATTGASASSPVWRIQKIDTTSGTTITWADGNNKFDNVATSLAVVAALTYS